MGRLPIAVILVIGRLLMDWVPVNWGVLKNPLNYFIVGTTLLVAAIAFDVVARYVTSNSSSNQGT
jgi:hypothetical protein